LKNTIYSRPEKNKWSAKLCYVIYLDITNCSFMKPSHLTIETFLTHLQTFMGIFSQFLEMYVKCKRKKYYLQTLENHPL
jgi:hypothetical protein